MPRTIAFDARKYGPALLADAADPAALPGFITSPTVHALSFTELALLDVARGHVDLDGEPVEVQPRRLLVTAPGRRRSWSLAHERLGGRLVFFEPRWIEDVCGLPATTAFPCLAGDGTRPYVDLDPQQFRHLVGLADAMRAELAAVRPDTAHALRALLYQTVVAVQRAFGSRATPAPPANRHVRAFVGMVDERFATMARVADYAAALGVSSRHLNACVRTSLGRSASDVIHARLVDEARRRLRESSVPVAQIADDLGFCDASYFVRFFRRHVGATPSHYRRDRENPGAHPNRH